MRIHPLLAALLAAHACTALAKETTLGEVTVTGTREGQALAETPATVGLVKADAIAQGKPTHPSQIMSQVPGVWVNVTGGEGHMTAIRQPLTTSPVYLYLEDGVPTRSTGFFNHNALYEINVPQAGGIEVSKGPGTALYGSDAIGGVINVLTKAPPAQREFNASAEAGSYGWGRVLVDGGDAGQRDAWRGSLNLTHTDGWRDATGYDRQAGTVRWDRDLGDSALLKTVLAFSNIDQQTAGSSTLTSNDYRYNPTKSYTPISYRKVGALRLSSAYEREQGDTLVSVTPYVRDNSMELLANWSLGYDPTVYTTANRSFGVLAKWRQDFAPMRTRLIAGIDLDVSPGSREENRLATLDTTGTGVAKVYRGYSVGARVYDYDVTFVGASPYVHGEFSPVERLRVSGGLRYDNLRYQFDNAFAANAVAASTRENGGAAVTRYYGQAADGTVSYQHLSPKLGASYALAKDADLYASYNHAFRAPSEGQLFRASSATSATLAQLAAQSALGLKPVKVNQYEIGLRGKAGGFDYQLAAYRIDKTDDILSYKNPVTNATQSVNAGQTRHQGVEAGLGFALAKALRLDSALSYAKHSYEEWRVAATTDYSGKEMEAAPRLIANTRLTWQPAPAGRVQLEWLRLGGYWMDQANTAKYDGHDLFNLRGSWNLNKQLALYGSVQNLADERFAESASVSSGSMVYAPGLARTFYVGIESKW